jgi:hypothetical protein
MKLNITTLTINYYLEEHYIYMCLMYDEDLIGKHWYNDLLIYRR